MSWSLILRPEAGEDIVEAGKWYEAGTAGRGREFIRAARACIGDVARNPERFPRVHRHVRHALLKQFPYVILFYVDEVSITVIACMHTRRDPADWMKRL